MAVYPRGSEWRMWDLHVHTPESIENNYSGPDPWDRFLSELRQLPEDIKVLGINDYWFLDGYEQVQVAFERGDLPNLEAVLPVLEVRCDTFGGVEGAISRLNLHLICDPELSVETLKAQLLPLMTAKYRLSPGDKPVIWSQFPTKDSLTDLGQRVIDSAPKAVQKTYGSPIHVGFSNLNVSFDKVVTGIAGNDILNHHIALALGKAEWADIKWSQQHAASKKHLINSVHAVFTAAPSREAFEKSRKALVDNDVNHKLLDCSDAHSWMDSQQATRLGACLTWINADPTFKGLVQALQEYDARVSVDERPPVLTRLARAPRSVIAMVQVGPEPTAAISVPWFNTQLQINPGFSVVIGNKGQGKSALLDCIALASNSDRHDDFSFLSSERFLSGGGKTAAQYEVILTWADGTTGKARLNAGFEAGLPVLVDYLPQSLIEKVCSADPDSTEKRHFETEIERVLFRHIDPDDRGTSTTLEQHLEARGRSQRAELDEARATLTTVTRDLIEATTRRDGLLELGLEQRLERLTEQHRRVTAEISALDETIGSSGSDEQKAAAQAVTTAVAERDSVDVRVRANRTEQSEIKARVEEVQEQMAAVRSLADEALNIADQIAATIGSPTRDVLRVEVHEQPSTTWAAARLAEVAALESDLESSGGLLEQSRVAVRKVADREAELASTGEEVHRWQQHRQDLVVQLEGIEGDPADADSIAGVTVLLAELAEAPSRLEALWADLEIQFHAVHTALAEIMALQKAAYGPATGFISSSPLANSVGLAFDVEFRVRDFVNSWIGMVNRQKLGDFYDVDRRDKDRAVLDGVDLGDADALYARLRAMVDRLGRERGSETARRARRARRPEVEHTYRVRADARAVAMAAARRGGLTLPAIASYFGKDHTSVMYAQTKVANNPRLSAVPVTRRAGSADRGCECRRLEPLGPVFPQEYRWPREFGSGKSPTTRATGCCGSCAAVRGRL